MTDPSTPLPADFRCGYVTIVGAPNVGKSTLMNGLLGQKISIVTNKPQTTRHKILGILSTDRYQAIFLDTPGIIRPVYQLQQVMMQSAMAAVRDADVLLYMIDATNPGIHDDPGQTEAFKSLTHTRNPVFLLINKIDLVARENVLPIIDFYSTKFTFNEIFPLSALRTEGTDDLLKAIVKMLPVHPPMYPLDIVSELNERFFVGEIIREKIFLKLREEIPYSATVDVTDFEERQSGKWLIRADIYVGRESQKGMMIGKGGAMLKEIGQMARKDIERFLDHQVFLELFVKVRKDWREDQQALKQLGYRPGTE